MSTGAGTIPIGMQLPLNPQPSTLGGAGEILLKIVHAEDTGYDPLRHPPFIGGTLQGVANALKLDVTFTRDDKMLKGTTLRELAQRLIDPGRRPLSLMAHRLARHPAPSKLSEQQLFDIDVLSTFRDAGILTANAADTLYASAAEYTRATTSAQVLH